MNEVTSDADRVYYAKHGLFGLFGTGLLMSWSGIRRWAKWHAIAQALFLLLLPFASIHVVLIPAYHYGFWVCAYALGGALTAQTRREAAPQGAGQSRDGTTRNERQQWMTSAS